MEKIDKEKIIRIGQEVMISQATILSEMADRLSDSFADAVELIANLKGKVVITGIGKSGHVGKKIAATLSSTGTTCVFMHAAEAVHGDLGIFQDEDVAIMISNSGSTQELVRLLPAIKRRGTEIIAIVGKKDSLIAQKADIVLDASVMSESDPLNIVPTASAIAALSMGDAIASALMDIKGFTESDFAELHPSGQLGRNLLLQVKDVMHSLSEISCVSAETPIREVVITMTRFPLGAACVTNGDQLLGIITDGDIRRALQNVDDVLSLSAEQVMTTNPIVVHSNTGLLDTLRIMENRPRQISVLPVTDEEHPKRLLGLIRIHDIYKPE
jgi:arabinose-5-phosphate isomerase